MADWIQPYIQIDVATGIRDVGVTINGVTHSIKVNESEIDECYHTFKAEPSGRIYVEVRVELHTGDVMGLRGGVGGGRPSTMEHLGGKGRGRGGRAPLPVGPPAS